MTRHSLKLRCPSPKVSDLLSFLPTSPLALLPPPSPIPPGSFSHPAPIPTSSTVLRVLKPSNSDQAQHSPPPTAREYGEEQDLYLDNRLSTTHDYLSPTPSSLPPRPSLPKPDRPKWKPPVQLFIGGKGSITGDEGDSVKGMLFLVFLFFTLLGIPLIALFSPSQCHGRSEQLLLGAHSLLRWQHARVNRVIFEGNKAVVVGSVPARKPWSQGTALGDHHQGPQVCRD
ncbi:hypothetical protein PQX77_014059 [Marasmius sp. AFHP31]|nr:hypothetical protein PQX77_014059 [Marasmius sp. AFHP31]